MRWRNGETRRARGKIGGKERGTLFFDYSKMASDADFGSLRSDFLLSLRCPAYSIERLVVDEGVERKARRQRWKREETKETAPREEA
jgi:hypothetical protein